MGCIFLYRVIQALWTGASAGVLFRASDSLRAVHPTSFWFQVAINSLFGALCSVFGVASVIGFINDSLTLLPRRFSLRTLIIAATAAGAVFGLAGYAIRRMLATSYDRIDIAVFLCVGIFGVYHLAVTWVQQKNGEIYLDNSDRWYINKSHSPAVFMIALTLRYVVSIVLIGFAISPFIVAIIK
jgi:hypothetical protein